MIPEITNFKEKYGQWAVITGGSSGIGKALATVLSENGMNCIIVSNQEKELEITSQELQSSYGNKVLPCYVDLASKNFEETISKTCEGLDVGLLINNASYGVVGEFLKHPIESYYNLVDVNIKAYLGTTHLFLPQMIKKNKGAVIYVSSINAVSPISKSAVYTASKVFELYFGIAMWNEIKDYNIDILQILPGPTRTGFQKKANTTEASWIKEPIELAKEALPLLGKELMYIPDNENKMLWATLSKLSMEHRVQTASKILEDALLKGKL